jgi:hypothetical protein
MSAYALAVQAPETRAGARPAIVLVLALPQPFTDEDLATRRRWHARSARKRKARRYARQTAFTGERAVALALARALDLLEQDKSPAGIVGALYSLETPAGSAAMGAKGRVTPSGWQGGPANGGVMPGEGAAFVVLSKNAAH